MASGHSASKAFYILLCAILGALLFIVIQRAAALIYYLLLNTNYQAYSLGLDYFQLSWVNFLTVLGALFFGFWYGIWLGLHWYNIVYEQGHGGLFHGFKGHWLHHEGIVRKPVSPAPAAPASAKSAVVAPVITTIKPASSNGSGRFMSKLTDRLERDSWDLDDLIKKDEPAAAPTKVIKPRAAVRSSIKVSTKAPVKRKPGAKIV
jgi:signal transduction histidine kinase